MVLEHDTHVITLLVSNSKIMLILVFMEVFPTCMGGDYSCSPSSSVQPVAAQASVAQLILLFPNWKLFMNHNNKKLRKFSFSMLIEGGGCPKW